ncbi:MAG: hypothetical protein GY795_31235 [Desulfobacterales bacterium]|nr:hypothetical protein [Desulfobacterales bacterium]
MHTGIVGAASIAAKVKQQLLEIHMHIDVNRDGKVDDDRSRNASWNNKVGAIILCNNDNDDDDAAKEIDWENEKIDTSSDESDIAPLEIRINKKTGSVPTGWKAFLEVDDKTKIRIFDKQTSGGIEIIGPRKGEKYELPDLNPDKILYGMEAIQYPGPDWRADPNRNPDLTNIFDGMITITLLLNDDAGNMVHKETAKVRVAPWIIHNHMDPTEKVYVAELPTGGNARFISDLSTANIPSLEKYPDGDRWMQDVMELGFSTIPKTSPKSDWHLPVVLRTANDRSHRGNLHNYPKNEMLKPGFGFTQALPPMDGGSQDSFGNLECSPPFTHKSTGKEYKFGRIVYGLGHIVPMQKEVTKFLEAQKVQEPFSIDVGWLIVGHVDEILSFCPMISGSKIKHVVKKGDGLNGLWKISKHYKVSYFEVIKSNPHIMNRLPKNHPNHGWIDIGDTVYVDKKQQVSFKVLMASPKRALDILNDLKSNGHGRETLFNGLSRSISVNSILGNNSFVAIQNYVQSKIDSARTVLKAKLGLEDSDFIHLPVLFEYNSRYVGYVAFTPGVVNMLVVTHSRSGDVTLCIPKPFGPVVGGKCKFEEDIETQLAGKKIKFIDDFATYHIEMGEIHCGTNSRREPPTDRWWWQQTGI